MDPGNPRVDAVGVLDGRIAAVGSAAEVTAAVGEEVERVDLDGLCLLPGFIDAHHHYCLSAFDRRMPDLHLAPGSSIEDVLEHVERAAGDNHSGWVRLQGYDPSKLREGRPPRTDELDRACADRPLLVAAYSFHEGVLNTRGLEEMGWDHSSPDPRNGALLRDRRGLTGEVVEQAFYLAEARARESLLETAADAWLAECEAHGRDLLSHGIVRVGDAAVPPSFDDLYERAALEGRLPVTVHRMPVSAGSVIEARLDAGPTGDGPAGAPIGPAKLFMDGAERCAMCFSIRGLVQSLGGQLRKALTGAGLAALRAAARSPTPRRGADGLLHVGMLFWEQEALDRAVASGAEHGLQIAQHAIGNEAVSRSLWALERSRARLSDLPGAPRLEHVVFLAPDQPRRIADAGATAVIQPYFVYDVGDQIAISPVPPGIDALSFADLDSAGVELAGSSDYPVAGYDVLAAVKAAATRRTQLGRYYRPDQAISAERALRAYTSGSARALGVDAEAGTLEPGKRADIVALSGDPLDIEPERLDELRVERTWIAGELVHEG
jgi:predicted amidohydrolase YtcJ